MKPEKILLCFSLLGILILLILSNLNKPTITDTIKNINSQNKYTFIELNNNNLTIIIQNKTTLNVSIHKEIEIYGNKEQDAIFANKIICKNCQ